MKVCSFCGKTEDQVKRMITSTHADICNECVLLCMDILIKCQAEYKNIELKNKD
jgi:ATP-dependent Clp protease ATP-binding subunit ClpX